MPLFRDTGGDEKQQIDLSIRRNNPIELIKNYRRKFAGKFSDFNNRQIGSNMKNNQRKLKNRSSIWMIDERDKLNEKSEQLLVRFLDVSVEFANNRGESIRHPETDEKGQ